jgi:hypothetical protein
MVRNAIMIYGADSAEVGAVRVSWEAVQVPL